MVIVNLNGHSLARNDGGGNWFEGEADRRKFEPYVGGNAYFGR